MAWLMAQTSGPARMTPISATCQFAAMGTPDEITPQANAHMGGNQVIGFNSASVSANAGTPEGRTASADRVMSER